MAVAPLRDPPEDAGGESTPIIDRVTVKEVNNSMYASRSGNAEWDWSNATSAGNWLVELGLIHCSQLEITSAGAAEAVTTGGQSSAEAESPP